MRGGFLGQFGNNSVTLSLADLPPHSAVSISFDLFIILSWDGLLTTLADREIWSLRVTGGPTLLSTTFRNNMDSPTGQNYPDDYPSAPGHRGFTGASETNTLGYFYGLIPHDSVYRITRTFSHQASSLSMIFSSVNMEAISNESWGLDNVVVSITPTQPVLTAPVLNQNGTLTLTLMGEPDRSYRIEGTSSLSSGTWADLGTFSPANGAISFTDQNAANFERRFYRAVRLP